MSGAPANPGRGWVHECTADRAETTVRFVGTVQEIADAAAKLPDMDASDWRGGPRLPSVAVLPFTTPERDVIRREFSPRFGAYPSITDGIFLRTWRAGPQAGQPKLRPAASSMLQRGLVEIRRDARSRLPYAFFTEAGVSARRQLARDRRALDSVRLAHICGDLGLSAESDDGAEA